MRSTRNLCAAVLVGATALLGYGVGANAVPLGAAKDISTESSGVQQVDYRGYGHCHWRHGRKWCHGDRGYRRGYYGGPSIYLQFGNGRRHHHRHNKWRRGY